MTFIPNPSANVRYKENPGLGIRMFSPGLAITDIHKSNAVEHPLHKITSFQSTVTLSEDE